MGGFAEGFILPFVKSHQVINEGMLSRGSFVGPSLQAWRVASCILLLAPLIVPSIPALPPGAGSRHPWGKAAPGLEELKAAPAVWQQLTKSSFMCDERIRLEREVSCSIPMTPAASAPPAGDTDNPAGPCLLPAKGCLTAGTCGMPAPSWVCFGEE